MRPRKLRRLLGTAAVGMVLAGASIGFAANADADINEDVFVTVIDERGIPYTTRTDLIAAGYAVCSYRDQGNSEIETVLMVQENSVLDIRDSGYFVGAAEAAFCPQHSVAAQSAPSLKRAI